MNELDNPAAYYRPKVDHILLLEILMLTAISTTLIPFHIIS